MKLFILFLTLFTTNAPSNNISEGAIQRTNLQIKLSERLTVTNVYNELVLNDILHPDIVIKQVVLETAWLNSSIATKHNNLFGMHYPTKRSTTATGYIIADNGAKVATYESWKDSVKDFELYQKYWIEKGKCLKDYYKFLNSIGYSETGSYVQTLKLIKI